MKRQQSSSVVFLTELLLALTIFALCSSVCASLFALSHRLSEQSSALSQSVIVVQSGVEAFKKYSTPEDVARVLNGSVVDNDCVVYYDSDWMTTGSSGAAYSMRIRFLQDDGIRYARILTAGSDGAEVYSLDVSALPTEGRP